MVYLLACKSYFLFSFNLELHVLVLHGGILGPELVCPLGQMLHLLRVFPLKVLKLLLLLLQLRFALLSSSVELEQLSLFASHLVGDILNLADECGPFLLLLLLQAAQLLSQLRLPGAGFLLAHSPLSLQLLKRQFCLVQLHQHRLFRLALFGLTVFDAFL